MPLKSARLRELDQALRRGDGGGEGHVGANVLLDQSIGGRVDIIAG